MNLHSVSHSVGMLPQSAFPPAVHEGSLFSTSPPALVVCWLTDDGHSGRPRWDLIVVEFVSLWRLVTLSTFSYVYWPSVCPLWEVSTQVICPFLIGLFVCFGWGFLALSLWIPYKFLDISPLPDASLGNILSHMVGCLFTLSGVSLAVQKRFGLM